MDKLLKFKKLNNLGEEKVPRKKEAIQLRKKWEREREIQ